jgi:DNA-binding SARP family transcriptional activator/WD40 repeat protein
MGIAVLGPLQVEGANGLGPRDRVVLSALVVRAGAPVTRDALADALWGDELPATWTKVVQGCIVRLRKTLGPAAIDSGPTGYRLTLGDDELDHRTFEGLLERGREALAAGDPARASYLAQEALDLWRGPALADLEEWEPGRVEAGRLEGLRMEAEEIRVEAELAAGHAPAVLERARVLVAEAPFRERRWALLARALHQSGRQPEALGAIKRARTILAAEFGLDPGRELVVLEAMLLRQDPSLLPAVLAEAPAICPYRGLLPYDAADADSFFGREEDVAACLRRLRDASVLAVVGPSGVGKSSLVRAGVVASLARSGPRVLVTAPGAHPMDSLIGLKPRQTLVVDQAEEAVTLCTDPSERARYLAALAHHVGSGGRLVLALRADHLGDLAPYPEIARVLEDGLYLLGPMGEAGLRSAIEGPARRAGLRVEPGLVDLLVREVEGEPAALPLLSHVLRETWERREGSTLTVAGYRACGGIRQAVSRTAESLYDAMDTAQRAQLRSLLLRLVLPTDDGDPVRARVPRAKVAVDAEHARLVERLVEARLVSIDGESVQIAHEALVRVWPRLRGWLDDDLDGQRLFRHLAGAADAWDAMGRPDSELYRGTRLGRAVDWRQRATPDLNEVEADFLDASVALSRAEERAAETRAARERRSRRRLRGALAGVGVVLVVALVAGLLAVRAADRAEENRRNSEAAARLAEARRAEAQAAGQDNPSTGLLLALEALTVDDSAQARDTLTELLTRAGSLEASRDLDGLPVSMSASPEGSLLAVSLAPDASEPGVHLFDSATLEPVEFARTAPSSIIRFSPDGRQLALAVNEWVSQGPPRIDRQPIQLYDLPGGTRSRHQLGGMKPDSGVEYAMEYSDDGRRLAAVVQHYDRTAGHWTGLGTATVWDLAGPARPVFGLTVPEYAAVALSPDGGEIYIAMTGKRSVRAYDVNSGRLLASAADLRLTEQQLGGLDVSPDGSTVAVTSEDRIIRLDATTLRRRGADLRAPDLAEGGRYSHHGNLLATASNDGSVVVWDVAAGALLHRFAVPGGGAWGSSVDWSADDRTLYAAGDNLMKWRLGGVAPGVLTLGEETPAVESTAYGLSLAAPDGHTLARTRSGRLWFVDLASGRETPRSAPITVWNARWSPDAHWLLTTAGDERLRIWDTRTGRQVAVRQLPRGAELVATFSSDGDRVYVVDRSGRLATYDRATLRRVRAGIRVGPGVTTIGARGDVVLVLRADGSFVRVRPETGEILGEAPAGTLTDPDDASNDLSPDGSLLATSDAEHRMRLLDVEDLGWIGSDARSDTLADAGGWVAFAPDGHQLAALQLDGIGLWDGHTGAYQGRLPIPELATGASIRYLPGSAGLLIAARDGRTWTADTRTDTWAERACAVAGRNLTEAEWTDFFPSRPFHSTCPQWPAPSVAGEAVSMSPGGQGA